MLVTIAPGEKTELHRQGVLLFVYLLEDDLAVDYQDIGRKEYNPGTSFLEAVPDPTDPCHPVSCGVRSPGTRPETCPSWRRAPARRLPFPWKVRPPERLPARTAPGAGKNAGSVMPRTGENHAGAAARGP